MIVSDGARRAPQRMIRLVLTAALLAALVWPVVTNTDGYPLSTYPMYSRARGTAVDFVVANGLGPSGERRRLSLELIGQSDDPLVVAGELRAAVREGRADRRCSAIARRVAETAGLEVETIEVVTERHDTIALVLDEESLLSRTEHARCEVEQ